MKALLYRDWERIEVADVADPAPATGEVLLRVEACGICGSEIECFVDRHPRRTPPLILGHEFCGRIAALGAGVEGFALDQPVAVNSVIACGTCFPCRRGEANLCTDRKLFGMHRPGGCAELVAAPAAVVYPRPADMDVVAAALIEPAANAVHTARLLPGHAKRTVFVFGAGTIGLLVLQAVRALHGARVAIADVVDERLACARALGAELTLNPKKADVVAAARAFSGADGVDYVIDAVGAAVTKRQSLAVARPGGAACWIGLKEGPLELDSRDVTNTQKTITGSYAFTAAEFLEAMRLLAAGAMVPGGGVRTFSLAEADAAFRRMCRPQGGDVKAVIIP